MPISKLTSSSELSSYCLRKLGSPVINIEVEATQLVDRVNEAVSLFLERHYNGVEEVYYKHVITASDVTNGYLTLPSEFIAVLGILRSRIGGSGELLDNINYHLQTKLMDSLTSMMQTDITGVYLTKQHISLIENQFNHDLHVEFNSAVNRLRVTQIIVEGDTVVINAYRALDPDEATGEVWNDLWLKKYATALIKKQWGSNIKKFSGVALPNGMTMNGKEIYDEATEEVQKLEDELEAKYTEPPEFFVG